MSNWHYDPSAPAPWTFTPDQADINMTALCAWREARGEGSLGMRCVIHVIYNRLMRRRTSAYDQVMRPLQFSSMTAPGDPQLHLTPAPGDKEYAFALASATEVLNGGDEDPTHGATVYYSDTIPFPKSWNPDALTFVTQIGHHRFYLER